MPNFTPARSQASTMARASEALRAIGFSHRTCNPLAAASMVGSACMKGGVHTTTACSPSSSNNSR